MPGASTGSRTSRRIRHHLVLAAGTAAIMGAVWLALPRSDWIGRLSMGSAYAAMAWMAASLLFGPLNVLRGRPNPVSFDLRRDTGIWAGLVGLLHVVVGLQAHLRGQMWLYFLQHWPDRSSPLPIRLDLFGLANYLGLAATFVLLLLLALSNDWSLRRLRSARWKSLQRWNYWAFALVVLHGAAYQLNARRSLPFVVILGLMIVPVVWLQVAGYRRSAGGRSRMVGEEDGVSGLPGAPGRR